MIPILVNGAPHPPEMRGLLERYVEAIERVSKPLSEPVRKAFLRVERHRFLEGFYRWEGPEQFTWVEVNPDAPDQEVLKEIYSASPKGLPIKLSPEGFPTSSTSSPPLMAYMLELLELKPGMKVLEIGTGTGYNAALMAEIVGSQELVTTLEIQPDLVERARRLLHRAGYGGIKVVCTDGFHGWPEDSPFDRIVATTCCADISPHWLKQLSSEGWMLVPLYHGGETCAPLVKVDPKGEGKLLGGAGFAHAQGMLSDSAIWAEGGKSLPSHMSGRKLIRLPTLSEFRRFVGCFHYFIALNELCACTPWGLKGQAILLWDKLADEGAGLIWQEDGWVQVVGSERLINRLEELYDGYEELGRPGFESYQMEFQVRPAPLGGDVVQRLRQVGDREWIIERQFTTQRVWLPA
ncbi:TPA: methyltransferase domain-containing protein [Candidatus Bipolaricaulota bacterium]|nr:methyltransferase domain-containing protein [Candidatus Bipolaricaulota bacterium]